MASQAIGMFNRRWRRLTQIRNLSPQTMGSEFEPSVILGIGFIQIESVKSAVKNQGLGFGRGSVVPSPFAIIRVIRGRNLRILLSCF